MSVRNNPEIVAAVVAQLTETTKTAKEIAENIRISPQTLSRIARDQGIDLNERRGIWPHGTSEDLWERIKREIETTGDPLPTIAERVGTSMHRIYSLASNHRYPLRNIGQEGPKLVVDSKTVHQLWRPGAVNGVRR